jgi:NAD binding domain of 6-phosphogluconate dehydrogenase
LFSLYRFLELDTLTKCFIFSNAFVALNEQFMPDVLPSSPTGDVYSKQLNASPLKIGFLGLGTIGSAIVGNLLKTGHEVTVWNRTMSKVLFKVILTRNYYY